jgi:hypothetical protein
MVMAAVVAFLPIESLVRNDLQMGDRQAQSFALR